MWMGIRIYLQEQIVRRVARRGVYLCPECQVIYMIRAFSSGRFQPVKQNNRANYPSLSGTTNPLPDWLVLCKSY